MIHELVLATENAGKIREIEQSLSGLPLLLRDMAQFPGMKGAAETGDSFEANALIKARAVCQHLGKLALADDSGLEVLALDGRPGIYSARYSDVGASDEQNNQKLLQELQGVPREQRQARFVCVMALVAPDGRELSVRGECLGEILTEARGHGGFGYDPLFFVPDAAKTFAELVSAEKARRSHRGHALTQLAQRLPEFLKLATS